MRRSIESYFSEDHDYLIDLFEQYQLCKEINFSRAKEIFKRFQDRFIQHAQWEEDILFPFFEEKTSLRDVGPTIILRVQHDIMKKLLEDILNKIECRNLSTDRDEKEFSTLFYSHCEKERNTIYPMVDELAEDFEKSDIYQKIEHLRSKITRSSSYHE